MCKTSVSFSSSANVKTVKSGVYNEAVGGLSIEVNPDLTQAASLHTAVHINDQCDIPCT